jgi:Uncharacterized conserved protein, COG3025
MTMQTEIEIKFFVASDIQPELSNLLNSLEIKESSQQQLGNVYFDTPTLALRQLDMGLRIRRCDAFAEQTIKCRGQVVGGLHARPEYNAPVSGDLPTLSAFPDEIWPTLTERDHIQQQLVAQFRTDFLRHHWLIVFEGAEIELAWDQGEIVGSQGNTTINELELELNQALPRRCLHWPGALPGSAGCALAPNPRPSAAIDWLVLANRWPCRRWSNMKAWMA